MAANVVLGGSTLAEEALAGELVVAPPSATIVSPAGGIQPLGQPTITWSYSSAVPRPQYSYQVIIKLNGSFTTVYDSGVVVSSATSHVALYTLLPSTGYIVYVYVSDFLSTGLPASASFSTDDSNPLSAITPLASIGTVYEVGINGVGYMLADLSDLNTPYTGEPKLKYHRQLQQLDAPRLSTGDTPFSEAFDRYTFVGFSDFTGGMGQQYRDRSESDPTRYLDSVGVNPFERGKLKLLNSTSRLLSAAFSPAGKPFLTNNSQYAAFHTGVQQVTFVEPDGTLHNVATGFNIGSLTTASDLSQDWYGATTTGTIFKGTNSWSGGVASLGTPADAIFDITWIGDRLAAFVRHLPAAEPYFSTFTTAGVEEVPTGRFKLPVGSSGDITSGGGMCYFSANSSIYGWKIGSTDAPTELFKVPTGGFVSSLLYVAGNLFAWVWKWKTTTTKKAVIYRFAISNQTTLVPSIVCKLGYNDTIDYGTGHFATDGENVIFPWNQMIDNDTAGVGCINLTSGGYAKWIYQNDSAGAGNVPHVVAWQNGFGFYVDTIGVYNETTTPLTTGYMSSSMMDLNSDLEKIIDKLSVGVNRFTATNQSVTVDYTVDSGNSYIPIPGVSLSGTGSAPPVQDFDWGKRTRTVGIRINLNNLGTAVYHEKTVLGLHPATVADMVITIPVNCSDQIIGMGGTKLAADSGPGKGAQRARTLEALVLTKIAFQDIDWAATQSSSVFEVVACDVRSVNVKNPRIGKAQQAQVAILTLRRRYA